MYFDTDGWAIERTLVGKKPIPLIPRGFSSATGRGPGSEEELAGGCRFIRDKTAVKQK